MTLISGNKNAQTAKAACAFGCGNLPLVRLAGLEPTAFRVGVERSIH
jgi:hypothetical protein